MKMDKRSQLVLKAIIEVLIAEPFLLVEKNGIQFIYCKNIDLFLLNPCHNLRKTTDNKMCNAPSAVAQMKLKNPTSDFFDANGIPMTELKEFLGEFGMSNGSVFCEKAFFWARNRNKAFHFSKDGFWEPAAFAYSFDNDYPAYSWPCFSIEGNKDSFDAWIDILFANDLNLPCLSDATLMQKLLRSSSFKGKMITASMLKEAYNQIVCLKEYRSKSEIIAKGKSGIYKMIEEDLKTDYLLNCDKLRADLETYDKKLVTDPNRGHWEIWGGKEKYQNLVPRNPLMDVHENGVVGIDFGTKSTIVVYQSDTECIVPMRIGTGELKKNVSEDQLENPTILELNSLENFMQDYRKGWRPQTKWCDIKVSHQANTDYFNCNSKKGEYSAFFSDIKQWAGCSKNIIRNLRDKSGRLIALKPYFSLKDDEFDPVEIYAYYLGLYINNMRNGIFLEYYLSFPVTYEKDIQMRIINSFKRGLKKSLPETVATDKDVMSKFRVVGTVSEPAAYAVCALQEYNFVPENDDKIYYGVFDFGGGTTDFDFGEWSLPTKKKYDFKITHFGAQGDKFLGGENLLELLAFDIFKKNMAVLQEKDITFTLPVQCQRFTGSEMVIADSSEAYYNTKNLMEALRPIWEKTETPESARDFDESHKIMVTLLHTDGSIESGVQLNATRSEIEKILKDRIESGIDQFFSAFETAFHNRGDKTMKMDKMYILLAGNSSKSPLVRNLFVEKISKYEASVGHRDLFVLLPPIGSKEFWDEKQKLISDFKREDDCRLQYEIPTGKTGVAFGLVIARKGGRIEIENLNILKGDVPFKFYLGYQSRGKFQVIKDVNTEMKNVGKLDIGKWYEFYDVEKGDDVVEVFYTDLPQALQNTMVITKAKKVRCSFGVAKQNGLFFIRAVNPHTFEYAVVLNRSELKQTKIYTKTLEG